MSGGSAPPPETGSPNAGSTEIKPRARCRKRLGTAPEPDRSYDPGDINTGQLLGPRRDLPEWRPRSQIGRKRGNIAQVRDRPKRKYEAIGFDPNLKMFGNWPAEAARGRVDPAAPQR
jgi:hypothetical protein